MKLKAVIQTSQNQPLTSSMLDHCQTHERRLIGCCVDAGCATIDVGYWTVSVNCVRRQVLVNFLRRVSKSWIFWLSTMADVGRLRGWAYRHERYFHYEIRRNYDSLVDDCCWWLTAFIATVSTAAALVRLRRRL